MELSFLFLFFLYLVGAMDFAGWGVDWERRHSGLFMRVSVLQCFVDGFSIRVCWAKVVEIYDC